MKENQHTSGTVSGELIQIEDYQSKHGGIYYECLFRMTATGSHYRSCIYPNCRNYSHWKDKLQVGNIFKGLRLVEKNKRLFIDGDSLPELIHKGESPDVLIKKVRSLGNAFGELKQKIQGELF